MKEIIKNNIKFIIIMSILIIFGLFGITYAVKVGAFSAISTYMNIANINATVTYDSPATNYMLPIEDTLVTYNSNDERISKTKFYVTGVGSNPERTIYDIAIHDISMGCELQTGDFKWRLYKNGTLLNEGIFSPEFDSMEGERLVLTEIQEDLTTTRTEYVLLIWISESCSGDIKNCDVALEQTKYLNKTFSGSIKVELTTKSKKELERTTSTLASCNYTKTNEPTCNNLTYNGQEQTLINTNTKYTIINNKGTSAGEYVVTVRPNHGYKWNDNTVSDRYINCTIKKKNASIIARDQTITSTNPLVNNTSMVQISNFVSGHRLDSINIDIEDKKLSPSAPVIVDANNNDVTNNYKINFISGNATVKEKPTITHDIDDTIKFGSAQVYSYNTNSDGTMSCSTSNSAIATCSINQLTQKITITPTGSGEVSIILSTGATSKYEAYSLSVPINIQCLKKAIGPSIYELIYNKNAQTGVSGGRHINLSGTTAATAAGSYTANATPQPGYCWEDGTTNSKSYNWSIAKKQSTCKINGVTSLHYPDNATGQITYTCEGDGSISVSSADPKLEVSSVGTSKANLTARDKVTTNLTLALSDGPNYVGTSLQRQVNVPYTTYTLTLNPRNGTVSPTTMTITYNTPFGSLPTPTRSGFTFIGWFDGTAATHDSSKNYIKHPIYYYADTYGDLYNAFNYDEDALYNHYVNWGQGEGRSISQFTSDSINNGNKTLYAGWKPNLNTISESHGIIIDYDKTYNNCSTMAGSVSGAVNKCYTNPFNQDRDFVFALPYLSTNGVTGYGLLSQTAVNTLYPNSTAHPYQCDHTMYITTTSSSDSNDLKFILDGTTVQEISGKTIPVKDDGYGIPFTVNLTNSPVTSSTRSSSYKYDFKTPKALGMSSSAIGIYSLRITNHFYKSTFLVSPEKSGVTASVSSQTAYTGDTVTYTASGSFTGWYSDIDCTNLVSSNSTYSIAVQNSSRILYAC